METASGPGRPVNSGMLRTLQKISNPASAPRSVDQIQGDLREATNVGGRKREHGEKGRQEKPKYRNAFKLNINSCFCFPRTSIFPREPPVEKGQPGRECANDQSGRI